MERCRLKEAVYFVKRRTADVPSEQPGDIVEAAADAVLLDLLAIVPEDRRPLPRL